MVFVGRRGSLLVAGGFLFLGQFRVPRVLAQAQFGLGRLCSLFIT